MVEPAVDDRPFLYLHERSIPQRYVVAIGLILLASIVFVRVAGGSFRPMLQYVDLFFMGAAFLLLETKSVVQFALLFGTTWFVNSLVFVGILLVRSARDRGRAEDPDRKAKAPVGRPVRSGSWSAG